jgi:hypothetical protein
MVRRYATSTNSCQEENTTKTRTEMKNFVFLTYGFEKPTPEIMEAWGKWFESIRDRIVEQGHFPRG